MAVVLPPVWVSTPALGTLSISTMLWFFFLIAVSRARFMFDHYSAIAIPDLLVLLVSTQLFSICDMCLSAEMKRTTIRVMATGWPNHRS
jgi:hypothetical protein